MMMKVEEMFVLTKKGIPTSFIILIVAVTLNKL